MKKTLSVKLDSNFYNQLELIANKKGVSKSFLVRRKLESLLLESDELHNQDLFNSMTSALEQNKSFPFNADWHKIELELAESKPEWSSADEAMRHSRKRGQHDESIH
jgi:metal-responsive CopG/Arc/MetJ family transcriptional regulator